MLVFVPVSRVKPVYFSFQCFLTTTFYRNTLHTVYVSPQKETCTERVLVDDSAWDSPAHFHVCSLQRNKASSPANKFSSCFQGRPSVFPPLPLLSLELNRNVAKRDRMVAADWSQRQCRRVPYQRLSRDPRPNLPDL